MTRYLQLKFDMCQFGGFRIWKDISRKKQGIIFVISYYRITILSELM